MDLGRPAARTTSDPLVPRLFDQPGNSIWTASQDEQNLRYSTSGSQAVHSLSPQTRQHNLSASQDLSSQQSIWSYNNSQNSQHHLVGALPSASFATPYSGAPDPGHQRVPSVDVHSFPSTLTRDFGSRQFDAPPHLMHQADVGMLPTSYLHTQSPLFETAPGSLYNTIGTPQNFPPHHTRHLSFHDPPAFSSQAIPPMSSIWANNG